MAKEGLLPAGSPSFSFYREVSRTFTPSDVEVLKLMTSLFPGTSLFWRVLDHGSLVKALKKSLVCLTWL